MRIYNCYISYKKLTSLSCGESRIKSHFTWIKYLHIYYIISDSNISAKLILAMNKVMCEIQFRGIIRYHLQLHGWQKHQRNVNVSTNTIDIRFIFKDKKFNNFKNID